MKRVCPACREIGEMLVFVISQDGRFYPLAFICPQCEHRWSVLSLINVGNVVCEN